MYVKKFEDDTLEGALQAIKQELGPDAIILKTITNKGIKGMFGKKRIEITAAISERNYVKKAKVDSVLGNENKEKFYQGSSQAIAHMIDDYNEKNESSNSAGRSDKKMPASGYNGAGLNKAVRQTKNAIKAGLDDFLSSPTPSENRAPRAAQSTSSRDLLQQNFEEMEKEVPLKQHMGPSAREDFAADGNVLKEMNSQQRKIDILEKKLYELSKNVESVVPKGPVGLQQIRTTLKTLDINEMFIQHLIQRATFELSEADLENPDLVFEFALRELAANIKTELPLFSSVDSENSPVVTLLISEQASGQTSMSMKLCALKKEARLIQFGTNTSKTNSPANANDRREAGYDFAEKMLDIQVVRPATLAEVVSECRKGIDEGICVFIDYRGQQGTDETRKFIDTLRRSFKKVEILICLSSIHSELYNRKVTKKFAAIANGVVFSHLDLCLNFGSIFNVHVDNAQLPIKFFGTGETIPDDIEPASSERLLGGMFQLD